MTSRSDPAYSRQSNHTSLYSITSCQHNEVLDVLLGLSSISAAKIIIGILMFSCGLLVRLRWDELKYGTILAVGGRG